jgi:hypothetical protein
MQYESGKQASIAGIANEHIVLGILLPFYPEVMLSSHQQSSHDLIIPIGRKFIRAQVKTASKSVSFTGGSRGGVDRTYIKGKDNPKHYTYSTKDTDVVIGITPEDFGKYSLYFVPSIVIENLNQKSVSTSKIEFTKNNLEVLENCLDKKYSLEKFANLI